MWVIKKNGLLLNSWTTWRAWRGVLVMCAALAGVTECSFDFLADIRR